MFYHFFYGANKIVDKSEAKGESFFFFHDPPDISRVQETLGTRRARAAGCESHSRSHARVHHQPQIL